MFEDDDERQLANYYQVIPFRELAARNAEEGILECPITYEEVDENECIVLTCCMYGVSYEAYTRLRAKFLCPMCRQELTTNYFFFQKKNVCYCIGFAKDWKMKQILEKIKPYETPDKRKYLRFRGYTFWKIENYKASDFFTRDGLVVEEVLL